MLIFESERLGCGVVVLGWGVELRLGRGLGFEFGLGCGLEKITTGSSTPVEAPYRKHQKVHSRNTGKNGIYDSEKYRDLQEQGPGLIG